MTFNSIVFFSLWILLSSCSGSLRNPPDHKIEQASLVNFGDTVAALGKNLSGLLQDDDGIFWLVSNGDGVFRYDGKTLTNFTEEDGLCSNFVFGIQKDHKGQLWFSTRDGICNFDGNKFTNYTHTVENAPKGKLLSPVHGLFFGHLNGICYYDGHTFTNFVIHPETYTPPTHTYNRPYGIYSTLVDKDGQVWFGTQSQGVCRYNGKTYNYLIEKDLAGPAVRTIFQDNSGHLWFGNNGGGLYRYDGKNLRNITAEYGLGNPEFLKGNFAGKPGTLARVWSINQDREGHIWIGTVDAGIWKFDGNQLTNFTTEDGLSGNSISHIYKDRQGELWYITNGGPTGSALCKFDGKMFKEYTFH